MMLKVAQRSRGLASNLRVIQKAAAMGCQVFPGSQVHQMQFYRFQVQTRNLMTSTSIRHFSKIVSVALPDLGEGTTEATIKEWFVKPGSKVNEVSTLAVFF